MSIFTETTHLRRPMAPPPHWNSFAPIVWQLVTGLAIALTLGIGTFLIVPVSIAFAVETTTTFFHEWGHGLIASLGQGSFTEMKVNTDGSGHALVLTTSSEQAVVMYASGLIFPAAIGALLGAVGLTRVGLDGVPFILGLLMSVTTFFYVEGETAVVLTLYGTGVGLFLVGLIPMLGSLKAGLVLMFSGMVSYGVVNSASYAYVEFINGNETRPSDARKIADILNLGDIGEVSTNLVGGMIGVYLVAALISWAWLARHWR